MTKRRIAVIGAGVSGLTTAIVLAEGGHDVEVFAEKIGSDTTSSRAAAIWFPYHIGKAGDEDSLKQVERWACQTFATLRSLIDVAPQSGVSMIEFRVFTKKEQKLVLSAFDSVKAVELEAGKVTHPWLSGYSLDVPLIDTPVYLNYLEERLGRDRIHVGQRISRIADVDPRFAVVVNCTGIDGKQMSPNDHSEMRPGRGVVLTGRSSLPYAVLDADDSETTHQLTYIVPRRVTGTYVAGGCDMPDDWNQTTDDDEGRQIFERCSAIDPSLTVDSLTGIVGLRPARADGVYLEREEIGGRDVIHNYGHGGGGFTVSWGCAGEVLGLVSTDPRD